MAKVWYCPNCGYEVTSRGRCHSCREKLVASALPQLPAGSDEDEVGYRLESWTDRDRGRLITNLNNMGILHRFEEDELVVDAEDEERVDDLIAELSEAPVSVVDEPDTPAPVFDDETPLDEAVRRLDRAAERLRDDPTDMHADADVAESSAAIFVADSYRGCPPEDWAAIGRVTRRLLSVLGADEALEDDIRSEATVLKKLLDGVLVPGSGQGGNGVSGERTEYELGDWIPEQRAQLGVLLDEAGIAYEWDGDDLVVPSERESEVEELFTAVGGEEEGDDEDRYTAVAELFAACARLTADPSDEGRIDAVLTWAEEAQGPPLLGMDDVAWLRIMSRVKALVEAIEEDAGADVVLDEAIAVHDMLRGVV
jgi:hypothetical protein